MAVPVSGVVSIVILGDEGWTGCVVVMWLHGVVWDPGCWLDPLLTVTCGPEVEQLMPQRRRTWVLHDILIFT